MSWDYTWLRRSHNLLDDRQFCNENLFWSHYNLLKRICSYRKLNFYCLGSVQWRRKWAYKFLERIFDFAQAKLVNVMNRFVRRLKLIFYDILWYISSWRDIYIYIDEKLEIFSLIIRFCWPTKITILEFF